MLAVGMEIEYWLQYGRLYEIYTVFIGYCDLGCQMAIAGFLDLMCLALQASGLWLRYTTLHYLILSFPWIAPPRSPPWRNPRKERDQNLLSGNLDCD